MSAERRRSILAIDGKNQFLICRFSRGFSQLHRIPRLLGRRLLIDVHVTELSGPHYAVVTCATLVSERR